MKRLATLMVLVALGAATQSCQDESFNEVEGYENEEDKPGLQ